MYYLIGITRTDIKIDDEYETIERESILAVFTTKEKAEVYIEKYSSYGAWSSKNTGLLFGYNRAEIREIPIDPV